MKIVDTRKLEKREDVQDEQKVSGIAQAMGSDTHEISWDEIPAIIINENNEIIDGHHRVEASLSTGLNQWRALVVDQSYFDSIEKVNGFVVACQQVCDDNDDYVTWGSC